MRCTSSSYNRNRPYGPLHIDKGTVRGIRRGGRSTAHRLGPKGVLVRQETVRCGQKGEHVLCDIIFIAHRGVVRKCILDYGLLFSGAFAQQFPS